MRAAFAAMERRRRHAAGTIRRAPPQQAIERAVAICAAAITGRLVLQAEEHRPRPPSLRDKASDLGEALVALAAVLKIRLESRYDVRLTTPFAHEPSARLDASSDRRSLLGSGLQVLRIDP